MVSGLALAMATRFNDLPVREAAGVVEPRATTQIHPAAPGIDAMLFHPTPPQTATSLLGGAADGMHAESMAVRLAKKTGAQWYVSCDLPGNSEKMYQIIEKKILGASTLG